MIESLQMHENKKVYANSLKLIESFYFTDADDQTLLDYLSEEVKSAHYEEQKLHF
jgi:hypothetical protein